MIDHRFVSKLCDAYDLGLAMSPLEPVTGGLLHTMFSLRTTNGRYAVKVLDKNVLQPRHARAEYARSEAVAAKFAEAGVPAVCAVKGKHGRLSDIGDRTAMVYPWIDGSMLTQEAAGPLAARRIGAILATMHDTEIDQSSFTAPKSYASSFGEWRELINYAATTRAPWVDEVIKMVPDLMTWEMDAFDAVTALSDTYVVSHRDLDQKNVLWSRRDTPAIVDWEGVGLVQPALEVMSAALDWSGQKLGEPDQYSFVALIAGYRAKRELPSGDCRLALKVLLGATGWLRANIRAAIDIDRSPERRAQRSHEIVKYAASLRQLASSLDIWASWCDDAKPIARSA
jgi:Ser/Thr protein kinase RdoA (MazF antagonist)